MGWRAAPAAAGQMFVAEVASGVGTSYIWALGYTVVVGCAYIVAAVVDIAADRSPAFAVVVA